MEENWLSRTFTVLKSDVAAIENWFVNPGAAAIAGTQITERAASATVSNIALGWLSIVPWWIWVAVAIGGVFYLLPFFKRRM